VDRLKGVVEGRYTFEEKKLYDATLDDAIDHYKKAFGHQASFKAAKWISIDKIKAYFSAN
jgi:hypothetical protein